MPSSFSALDAGVAILRVAQEFLDLSEVENNKAWSDPAKSTKLRALMERTGWQAGWAYCMALAEACYIGGYETLGAPAEVVALIRKRFTPSVMSTFTNCGKFAQSRDPLPGSVFFMQNDGQWLGHAGLIVMGSDKRILTVEGNTSPALALATNADREGDGIYAKIRVPQWTRKKGLWMRGYLNPLGLDDAVKLAELQTAPF
jgi:hypothetical protein